MESRAETICNIHREIEEHQRGSMERIKALEELYEFLQHCATVGVVFADVLDEDAVWPTGKELTDHVDSVDEYLEYADERSPDRNVCTETWKP